jgi:predicted dehydrogenase
VRPEAAAAVAREFGVPVAPSLKDLIGRMEAAVVATPTVAHAEVGCRLLERGIHVLVEKPMAPTLAEADRLLAATDGRVLAVGHVEFFNPAVQALLATGVPPRFVEVQRLAVFTPRSLDVDVVLDLMIHDLQILQALDGSPVAEVRATGINVLSPRVDIANARIALASGCVANLTASRVSFDRVRRLRVFSRSRYHSIDYLDQEIKGYRLEERGGERRILPDDLPVEHAEPLQREIAAFVAACRGEVAAARGRAPAYVDGAEGRRALATALAVVAAIAEAAGRQTAEADRREEEP